jgi:3-methyladenine DNA glycosylase AlkD
MLLLELRTALKQAGDPVRAPAMQAYMKSAMPYHGVPTPLLRQVCKATFADVQFATASQWQAQVLDLWRDARFREERYAALYLAGDKRARHFQTLSAMKMYEELISDCCMHASNPRSDRGNSFCRRRSVGRCGSTPGLTRRR